MGQSFKKWVQFRYKWLIQIVSNTMFKIMMSQKGDILGPQTCLFSGNQSKESWLNWRVKIRMNWPENQSKNLDMEQERSVTLFKIMKCMLPVPTVAG